MIDHLAHIDGRRNLAIWNFNNEFFFDLLQADDLSWCLPTFWSATFAGQVFLAVVRWRACRVDHLHAFLSNAATGWLCVCARTGQLVQPSGTEGFPFFSCARLAGPAGFSGNFMAFPRHAGRSMETTSR